MLRFQCDYQEGAHPSILKKMKETNYEQTAGYGNDPYCESARKKQKLHDPESPILIGRLKGDEVITDKKIQSARDNQLSLFDFM